MTIPSREDWAKGPWDDEPDKLELEAHGLQCLILRNRLFGHLCGYVEVPKGHPLHGVDDNVPCPALAKLWDERRERPLGNCGTIPMLLHKDDEAPRMDVALEVHGSVTYTGRRPGPEQDPTDESWWVGFDCAHAWDLQPYRAGDPFWASRDEVYRDIDYVRRECEKLAEQLARVAR